MFETTDKDDLHKYDDVNSNLFYGKKGNKKVKYSIIIPTYKRAALIWQAIDSAINQKGYFNYEILIVENGESDSSQDLLDGIIKIGNDKIRYYRNEKNLGMTGNWNRATMLSSGQYIVMLHDDDLLHPYYLKILDEFLRTKNVLDCCGVINIWFKGHEEYNFNTNITYYNGKSRKYNINDIYFGRSIKIAGMAYSKKTFLDIGGFREKDYPIADTLFLVRQALFTEVEEICQPLAAYRVQNNASTNFEVMKQIVIKVDDMRRELSNYNMFLHFFHKTFGRQLHYLYVLKAIKLWNFQGEKDKFLLETNAIATKNNHIKVLLCKFFKNSYIIGRILLRIIERT